jgi:uncharacterized FlaG/YvyC family protein
MKIAPVIDAIGLFGIRPDSNSKNPQQNKQQKKPDENNGEEKESEKPKQSFEESVESFNNDPQAVASGLSVSAAGSGPGLRVILKDGQGAVIRQISGEEFVKLREEVAKSSSGRGKILDRKL